MKVLGVFFCSWLNWAVRESKVAWTPIRPSSGGKARCEGYMNVIQIFNKRRCAQAGVALVDLGGLLWFIGGNEKFWN